MRCLIDTHALIWWLTQPDRIPEKTRDLLDDLANDVLISIATPWEMSIKIHSGKLDARDILYDIEYGHLDDQIRVLMAEVRHVIRAGSLPLHHRDPFDRLMIAQALELNLPIVSNDRIFDRYGVQRIWA